MLFVCFTLGQEERDMAMIKKIHFSIRLEPALLKRLRGMSNTAGVSASALARLAVRHYVDGNAGYNRRGKR